MTSVLSRVPRPIRIPVAPWTVTEGESYATKAGRQAVVVVVVVVVVVGAALAASAYVGAPWVAETVSGSDFASCEGIDPPAPRECPASTPPGVDPEVSISLPAAAATFVRGVAPYAVPSVLALWLLVAGTASLLGGEPARGELPATLERTSWGVVPLLSVAVVRLVAFRSPPPTAADVATVAAARTFATETMFGTGHPILWRASLLAYLWAGYVFAWTVAVDRDVSIWRAAAVVAVPMGILAVDAVMGTAFAAFTWQAGAVGLGLCVVGLVPLVGAEIIVGFRRGVETIGQLGAFGQLLSLLWRVGGFVSLLAGSLLVGASLHVV